MSEGSSDLRVGVSSPLKNFSEKPAMPASVMSPVYLIGRFVYNVHSTKGMGQRFAITLIKLYTAETVSVEPFSRVLLYKIERASELNGQSASLAAVYRLLWEKNKRDQNKN